MGPGYDRSREQSREQERDREGVTERRSEHLEKIWVATGRETCGLGKFRGVEGVRRARVLASMDSENVPQVFVIPSDPGGEPLLIGTTDSHLSLLYFRIWENGVSFGPDINHD